MNHPLQDSSPLLDHASINRAMANATHAAGEANVSVVVAIVDTSGVLAGLVRMPGSFLASVDYAQWKAWTAASFDMSTAEFASFLDGIDPQVREGLLKHRNVTSLSGGFPIRRSGRLIGALGVSGGNAEQDEAIAKAGLGAFCD